MRGFFELGRWHVKPADSRTIFGGLDGLRGIAILMVIACHSMPYLFGVLGPTGVQLFFVLSGFLITSPFFKRAATADWYPRGYCLRRAAKVLPPFYLSIICFTILLIFSLHNWRPLVSAVETMFFVHIWFTPQPPIQLIYWSLAAEVSFYITVPIIFLVVGKHVARWPWAFGLLLICAAEILIVVTWPYPRIRLGEPIIHNVLQNFMFFGWGALFNFVRLAFPSPPPERSEILLTIGFIGFLILTGSAVIIHCFNPARIETLFSYLGYLTGMGGFSFLMLFVIFENRSFISQLLNFPLLKIAGLVSYEWYLFHLLFLRMALALLPAHEHSSIRKILVSDFFSFVLAFAFAALIYRGFSLPILRWAHERALVRSGQARNV